MLLPIQGSQQVVALVFVSAEAGSITEMWRAFANIFLFTAVVVMLVAFITSSVTSLRMTRPLKGYGGGRAEVQAQGV